MEARVAYGSFVERPRLVVIHDDGGQGRYSALPHAVLFSDLSDGAIRLYAVLQSHWWGESGECTALHATLAAESGKRERTVRALLSELEGKGFIVSRRAGRGQSKAYRAADQSGRNLPVATGENPPVERPKRQKSASQAAENGQFKRQKSAAPKEEDSGKKPLEVDTAPTEPLTATTVDQATILRSLSADARAILDWHRQRHGRRQPAKLTPESVRVLEEAVADLGVERLREAVSYMAGLIPPVPELSKAIRAARTKRERDENPGVTPRRNGTHQAVASAQAPSIAARVKSERF